MLEVDIFINSCNYQPGLKVTPTDLEALSLRRQSYEALGQKAQALADAKTLWRLSSAREEQSLAREEESPAKENDSPAKEEDSPVQAVIGIQQTNSKFYVCLVMLIVD